MSLVLFVIGFSSDSAGKTNESDAEEGYGGFRDGDRRGISPNWVPVIVSACSVVVEQIPKIMIVIKIVDTFFIVNLLLEFRRESLSFCLES